jgi:hypothetical protein
MTKKYIVALTDEEREKLKQITRTEKNPAYKVNHARILLKADNNSDDSGWNDSEICKGLDVGVSTGERVRRCFVEFGIEAALQGKEQLNRRKPVLEGVAEAYLIALTCSDPPDG